MARSESTLETIVASSMKIEGELRAQGNVKIDGIITGKVQTSQDLIIGPNAQIDADVIALNAIVGGVVKGNLTIKGSLQLLDTAKVIGNISCGTLAIQDGAYFSGACRMQEPKLQVEPTE